MGFRIKKDIEKNAVVYFNANTGMKIRMAEDEYVKSTTPELVDIKITDYCAFGCKHCYMGSTIGGKHAAVSDILNIFHFLSRMEVFEVAIGGGEPTQHPKFSYILAQCVVGYDIVPNFTTFTDEWINIPKIVSAVNSYVGGIGVSVYSDRALDKFYNIKNAVNNNVQVTPQHVVGQVPFHTTNKLVQAVDKILLLGYKNVGFGKNKKEKLFTDDQIKELFSHNKIISVDTAFLDNYGHVLDDLGISKKLRSSPEGKFSCFIDAVDLKMGPSSYTERLDKLQHPMFHDIGHLYKGY